MELPALRAGVTFTPTGKQPYFKVVASLGVAPDILWQGGRYTFHYDYQQSFPQTAVSAWTLTAEGSEAMTLQLQLPYTPPDEHFALVLTLGVLMGTPDAGHRWRR